MEKEIAQNILVVEDDPVWLDRIKSELSLRGFNVRGTQWGTEGLKTIIDDTSCEIKAVVLDWYLYIPGKKPEEEQELQGPALCDEILRLRPELPTFALTVQKEPEEIADILIQHRFTGFFSKGSFNPNRIAKKLKESIYESEEIISNIPTGKVWDTCKIAYLNLRENPYKWRTIESQISDRAKKIFDEYYDAKAKVVSRRSLGDRLGLQIRGQPDLINILIGRRVVFAAIFFNEGRMYQVEESLGYPHPRDEKEDNINISSNEAFKVYISGLGIRYKEVIKGKGKFLPEEKEWLKSFCKENELDSSLYL